MSVIELFFSEREREHHLLLVHLGAQPLGLLALLLHAHLQQKDAALGLDKVRHALLLRPKDWEQHGIDKEARGEGEKRGRRKAEAE